jgi:hypothetical protein
MQRSVEVEKERFVQPRQVNPRMTLYTGMIVMQQITESVEDDGMLFVLERKFISYICAAHRV